MAEIHMKKYNFRAAEKIIEQNLASNPHSEDFLWLKYRLVSAQENLPLLDSLSVTRLSENPDNVPALLTRGNLHYRLLNYDSAGYYYAHAVQKARDVRLRTLAVVGISEVKYKQQEHQAALDTLIAVLDNSTFSDRLLFAFVQPLIRLGRVQEASRVLKKAIEVNPFNELAHYYLGNGYAQFNYTQLEEKYPQIFADGEGQKALIKAEYLLRTGEVDAAETLLLQMTEAHPNWVEPLTILGAIYWAREDFEKARAYFKQSLDICPYWGRAHNGYAKAMEGKRMQVSVYRQEDWKVFEAQPMPDVPRIAEFVVNWHSLSPRHQKQVVLSVAPWKAFVPVLVESGCTYYIKPLYERLSECPGLKTLEDLRISYDSRLWDDVRGCGGFNTVTGIEDVERTIYRRYNTVLHELTHQVHYILTPDEMNLIQETYRKAKEREEAGTKTFMSRYQASSVWEYFAEGANAYFSPRRNDYDTREIVRERLFDLDTALVHVVEHFLSIENDEPYYVIGLVNAGRDYLEKGRADDALAMAEKAYKRDSSALSVLALLSHVCSIQEQNDLAIAYAETLRTRYPERSETYVQLAETYFHQSGDKKVAYKQLSQGLPKVLPEEVYLVELALGGAFLRAGDYKQAAKHYREVLDYQSDNSDALWGMAQALAGRGDKETAKRHFEQALERRSGIVELRLDYARFLLETGDTEGARREIKEAEHLDPEGDDVITFTGWLEGAMGSWPKALRQFEKAISSAPHNDLAKILKLQALKEMNRVGPMKALEKELRQALRNPKPAWVYFPRNANFISVHEWPDWQVKLLESVLKQ